MSFIIKHLEEKDLIERIDLPDSVKNVFNKNIVEELYSNRFGLQIASFDKYENNSNYTRFQMYDKLRSSHITIIGAGGVGSMLAVLLAAIGIREISIIDNDIVSESNLTRQIFYKESDVDKVFKVDSLKRFINEFTSHTTVNAIKTMIIDKDNFNKCIDNTTDLIIQTGNIPRGKIDTLVNSVCIEEKIPCLFSRFGSIGPLVIPGKTSCYTCYEENYDLSYKGMLSEFLKNTNVNENLKLPSFVLGPWELSSQILKKILRFLFEPESYKEYSGINYISKFDNQETYTFIDKIEGCVQCELNK